MVEFRVLGPLEIVRDGRTLAPAGARARAVLAVLLLHANRPVSVDRLIDDLWGASPPARARGMVHNAVSQIRRVVGDPDRLVRSPAGYQLRVAADELDLSRFERLVAAADEHLAAGNAARAEAAATDAIALWRGEALAEFAFEPFASPAMGRLEELRVQAERLRVEAMMQAGRSADAVAELRVLVAQHPWSERLRYVLVLALYRSGRQADALSELRGWRQSLDEQLGIAPAREIRELEQRILQHDSALAPGPDVAPSLERGRAVLLVVSTLDQLGEGLRLCAPLAGQARELVVVQQLEQAADLPGAVAELSSAVAALPSPRPVRCTAFRSAEPAQDLRRLARDLEAALVVQVIEQTELRLETFAHVECDATLLRAAPFSEGRRVVVPFGGSEHDWLALELAAALAAGLGAGMRLFGGARESTDASRVLAVASVAVQRFFGVAAEPAVGAPSELVAEARSGAVLVLGVSDRWRSEGLVGVRADVMRAARGPVLVARRGHGPSVLAPPAALTRFTWSLAGD